MSPKFLKNRIRILTYMYVLSFPLNIVIVYDVELYACVSSRMWYEESNQNSNACVCVKSYVMLNRDRILVCAYVDVSGNWRIVIQAGRLSPSLSSVLNDLTKGLILNVYVCVRIEGTCVLWILFLRLICDWLGDDLTNFFRLARYTNGLVFSLLLVYCYRVLFYTLTYVIEIVFLYDKLS